MPPHTTQPAGARCCACCNGHVCAVNQRPFHVGRGSGQRASLRAAVCAAAPSDRFRHSVALLLTLPAVAVRFFFCRDFLEMTLRRVTRSVAKVQSKACANHRSWVTNVRLSVCAGEYSRARLRAATAFSRWAMRLGLAVTPRRRPFARLRLPQR